MAGMITRSHNYLGRKGRKRPISLPSVVGGYLRELKATMNSDVERARLLLVKLIGPVMLRGEGARLVAEVQGNSEASWN